MARTKAISDEQIVAALIAGGSLKTAAATLGMNPQTISNRLTEPACKQLFEETQKVVYETSLAALLNRIDRAMETSYEKSSMK